MSLPFSTSWRMSDSSWRWRRPLRAGEAGGHLAEPLLTARIALVALAIPLLVRLPLPRQVRLLAGRGAPPPIDDSVARWLVRRVEAVQRRGWPLIRPGCLTRGLTSYHLLQGAGFPVALLFGVGEVQGEVVGHCWLDHDGEPFMERVDPRATFVESFRFPAAADPPRA